MSEQVLFEGRFGSLRQTIEAAITEKVPLAFADLRHANLAHAQMDGVILNGAQLDQDNLLGTNISEAQLCGTSFKNAHMHSTVLCESILDAAKFEGTLFGGTDISGTNIKRCTFDTLSALDLNFRDTASMERNIFKAFHDDHCEFSRPPLVLKGLTYPVACLDRRLLINDYALTSGIDISGMPSRLSAFTQAHWPLLETLLQAHTASPSDNKTLVA